MQDYRGLGPIREAMGTRQGVTQDGAPAHHGEGFVFMLLILLYTFEQSFECLSVHIFCVFRYFPAVGMHFYLGEGLTVNSPAVHWTQPPVRLAAAHAEMGPDHTSLLMTAPNVLSHIPKERQTERKTKTDMKNKWLIIDRWRSFTLYPGTVAVRRRLPVEA